MNAFSNFDQGGGGGEGPWLAWSARGTLDGAIQARSFYVRDADGGKTPVDAAKGFVLDVWNMKTGWQRSEGIAGTAPEWKWGASVAALPEKPGDDWKKGFSIPVAIGKNNAAVWEQAGAGAWNAFAALIPAIQAQCDMSKLPVVKMTGARVEQFKRGSTATPTLEIDRWVDRPACLKPGFDTGSAEEVTAAPVQQPAQQPVTAAVDPDDFG